MDHAHQDAGVEPEGIAAVSVLIMVLAIVGALTVVVVGGVQIALGEFRTAEVSAIETTGYPQLRETRAKAEALLNQTQPIDAEAGIYRIPIERAMQLEVARRAPGSTAEITLTR